MSDMGFWVMVVTGLFIIGNVMALKPGGIDQRLDKLRMAARRLKLNPKLIQSPEWMRGGNSSVSTEYGKGMVAQYALILPEKKLPEVYYQVIDNQLRPLNFAAESPLSKTYKPNNDILYRLDKLPLDLPQTIAPFVKAVYAKANSIVVFWDDTGYVKPGTNPDYDPANIEADLSLLKQQLQLWADILQP